MMCGKRRRTIGRLTDVTHQGHQCETVIMKESKIVSV